MQLKGTPCSVYLKTKLFTGLICTFVGEVLNGFGQNLPG